MKLILNEVRFLKNGLSKKDGKELDYANISFLGVLNDNDVKVKCSISHEILSEELLNNMCNVELDVIEGETIKKITGVYEGKTYEFYKLSNLSKIFNIDGKVIIPVMSLADKIKKAKHM